VKIACGMVEAEDKPQLGRQKEARNFRVTWNLQRALAPHAGRCYGSAGGVTEQLAQKA